MTETPGEREGRVLAAIPEDTYARRLMLARDHAGHLTIREAAEKCGLNYASWANWERGARSRTLLDDAQLIAEGLGVDREWLLYGGPLTQPKRATRTGRGLTYSFGRTGPGRGHERRPRRLRGPRVAA